MTTLIQFIGSQCAGKTTLAAGLFYTMKKEGLVVELIQEPARRRVYAGLPVEGAGQLSIITELYEHITDVVRAGVPWVVVDTHILTPLFYTLDDTVEDLCFKLLRTLRDRMGFNLITVVPVGDAPTFSIEGRAYKEGQGLGGSPFSLWRHNLDNGSSRSIDVPYTIEPIDLYHRVQDALDTLYEIGGIDGEV